MFVCVLYVADHFLPDFVNLSVFIIAIVPNQIGHFYLSPFEYHFKS